MKWRNWTLITVFVLAILTSLMVTARRYQVEHSSPQVALAMSNHNINRLSVLGGIPRSELLYKLKEEIGLSAVALEEQTIADFVDQGALTLLKGSEIMNLYRVGHVNRYLLTNLYKKIKVKPEYFYLIIEKKEDYELIRRFLSAEFGNDAIRKVGNHNILEVLDEKEDLLSVGLGLSQETIRELQGFGFTVIPRLRNTHRLNTNVMRLKFESLADLSNQEPILFHGSTILGFPGHLEHLRKQVESRGLRLGVIEFVNQAGLKQVAAKLPRSVVRFHSIPQKSMEQLSEQRAINRYLRATEERGISVLFVHPFFNTQVGENLFDKNFSFINQLESELEAEGHEIAESIGVYDNTYVPIRPLELVVVSLGILAGLILLIGQFYPLSLGRELMISVVFLVILYLGIVVGKSAQLIPVLALISAIVFPSLAIISQFPHAKDMPQALDARLKAAVIYLLSALMITLVGALFVTALMSAPKYLLGIVRFSGVKLSFILPLLLIWLYFFLHPHRMTSMFHVFKRLFYTPVRTVYLVAAIACILFVFLYLLRSGNYLPFQFPFEMPFRAFLENNLIVRPRTKEFLIGYPLLLLSFMYLGRGLSVNWLWFFNGLASVALISVMNTFCHFHTPLEISVFRVLVGLMLGVVVTIGYVVVIKLSAQVIRAMMR